MMLICLIFSLNWLIVNDCAEYLFYTGESLDPFGANLPLVHNLIQVPIRFLGPNNSEYEFPALVDTGASTTFYNAKTVQCLNFTPKGSGVRVKNGDGSSQYSLGSISPRIAIGAHFKENMLGQVIQLERFDMIIGIDMFRRFKMEIRHDPFRITALCDNKKRVDFPVCINSIRHADGHDIFHYLYSKSDFHFECKGQGITVQDSYVVIPDNNDLFSYATMLEELHEASTSSELFTKIGAVDVQERKAFGQDPPGVRVSSTCPNRTTKTVQKVECLLSGMVAV